MLLTEWGGAWGDIGPAEDCGNPKVLGLEVMPWFAFMISCEEEDVSVNLAANVWFTDEVITLVVVAGLLDVDEAWEMGMRTMLD